jgi:hypothetical protein
MVQGIRHEIFSRYYTLLCFGYTSLGGRRRACGISRRLGRQGWRRPQYQTCCTDRGRSTDRVADLHQQLQPTAYKRQYIKGIAGHTRWAALKTNAASTEHSHKHTAASWLGAVEL